MTPERPSFADTGIAITPIGFGGAEIGFLDLSKDEVTRLLNTLLDLGINLVDTAAMYAKSEGLIGDAIGSRRDEYVLVSKCGTKIEECNAEPWTPELINFSVDRSLKSLKTDRLDVMLLHSCDQQVLERGDALETLIKARDAGKIRHVGYSGDNEAGRYGASLGEVAAIETSVSICDQVNIDKVLPTCVERGHLVLAKRPIANAAWKNLDEQPGFYSNYAKVYTERLQRMDVDPESLGFDGAEKEAWAELALRFTLSQPGVTCAIVGTTNLDHVRKNLEFASRGPLDAATIQKIRDAFLDAETKADDRPWTGQT